MKLKIPHLIQEKHAKKEEGLLNKHHFTHCIKYKKIVILSLIAILCVIIVFIWNKSGSITTISESSLKEVLEISEISTVEYTYNSIVTVSDKDVEKYHVSYKGIVKAGFDFNDIMITENKKEKKIFIDVPDIQINSVYVDDKSLDFIFIKEKYNTETTYQEAYKKSVEDLTVKAESNAELRRMAKENAITTISALIKPWEEQLPEEYQIEYN